MAVQQIEGLAELGNKLVELKKQFNESTSLNNTCMKAARLIAKNVRRNIKRGPTSNLLNAVQAVRGRKAWKQGAAAIARVNAWYAPHAHLVEAGTKAYAGLMKIPLAAVSQAWWMKLTPAQRTEAGKRGYVFIQRRMGATAQHPFRRAVESSLSEVKTIMWAGAQAIVDGVCK